MKQLQNLHSILFLVFALGICSSCVAPEDEIDEAFSPYDVSTDTVTGACYLDKYATPDEVVVKKLDILVVIDTSASIIGERGDIADGFDAFINALPDDVDLNMGVILGHGPSSSRFAKLYKKGTEPLVLSNANLTRTEIQNHLKTKIMNPHEDWATDGGEMGLYSLYSALNDNSKLQAMKDQGMMRDDAALVVVFVADENDICSDFPEGIVPVPDPQGKEASAYANFCIDSEGNRTFTEQDIVDKVKELQGDIPFVVGGVTYNNAATIPLQGENEIGYGYNDAIKLAGGISIDLATGDFGTGLGKIGKLATTSMAPVNSFNLSVDNVDESTIETKVNGAVVSHTYDSALNQVNLVSGRDALSVATVKYCEKPEQVAQSIFMTTGGNHTCVILASGDVKCWGDNAFGQLGQGHTDNIGDDETPASISAIDLGAKATQISAGLNHTCALLDNGSVKCWGQNNHGQLGLGHMDNIGDDELPSSVGAVSLGESARKIYSGFNSNCAVLQSGNVKCWGNNQFGQLGYGHTNNIGDDELPSSAGNLSLGSSVTQMDYSTISFHACAILSSGGVKCWGRNSSGQLGYGHTDNIGDNELPSSVGTLPLGAKAIQVATGNQHTCALLEGGSVKCWGSGAQGVLGNADLVNIGDNESISGLAAVNFGVSNQVTSITAGNVSSCAIFDNKKVKCWGNGSLGKLGYGNTDTIGDDETPAAVGFIATSDTAKQVAVGVNHTCILTVDSGLTQCWGAGLKGATGYGTTNDIGDNETPDSYGFVPVQP